jgi:hypothetical protein
MKFNSIISLRNHFHFIEFHLNKRGLSESIAAEELPLRSELFGSDQMRQHGRILASGHALRHDHLPDQLLSRLAENETVLIDVRRLLTAEPNLFLRRLSRKTWAFFETFVGPQDHWLPPDNYQEHPVGVVSHRTSPTNMGLALSANLSAYDLGYISAGSLIERTAGTLHTMDTMERHRGHFYNRYDTQSLGPLFPLCISSEESGNLAGHLLTLGPGLLGLADLPIVGSLLFHGLNDTLGIIGEIAESALSDRRTELQNDLDQAIAVPPLTVNAVRVCLLQLSRSAAMMITEVEKIETDLAAQLRWWTKVFAEQCRDALDEITLLAPRRENLSTDTSGGSVHLDTIPTLRQVAEMKTELHCPVTAAVTKAATRLANIDYLARFANRLAQME